MKICILLNLVGGRTVLGKLECRQSLWLNMQFQASLSKSLWVCEFFLQICLLIKFVGGQTFVNKFI